MPNLDGLENAFNESPCLDTASAWHNAAIEAYRNEEISLSELRNIGDAVRAWGRANGIGMAA